MEKSEVIKRAILKIERDVAQEIKDHEISVENLMIYLDSTNGRDFYEIISKIDCEKYRHGKKLMDLERSMNTIKRL
jgi:hypothetical protein